MPRASVCFDYQGHCVEYGTDLNARLKTGGHSLDARVPFVCIDGMPIQLTPELVSGWNRRAFGEAVRAYVARTYPPD